MNSYFSVPAEWFYSPCRVALQSVNSDRSPWSVTLLSVKSDCSPQIVTVRYFSSYCAVGEEWLCSTWRVTCSTRRVTVQSRKSDCTEHEEWLAVHEEWLCRTWRVTCRTWSDCAVHEEWLCRTLRTLRVTVQYIKSDCAEHEEWLAEQEEWLCSTWRVTLHSSWTTFHGTIYQSIAPQWQLQVSQLLVSLKCWQGQIDTEDGDCALGKLVGAKEDIILEFIAICSTLSCVVHLSYSKLLISPNFYRSIPAHLFFIRFVAFFCLLC